MYHRITLFNPIKLFVLSNLMYSKFLVFAKFNTISTEDGQFYMRQLKKLFIHPNQAGLILTKVLIPIRG